MSGFARSVRSTIAYGPLLRVSGRTPLLRLLHIITKSLKAQKDKSVELSTSVLTKKKSAEQVEMMKLCLDEGRHKKHQRTLLCTVTISRKIHRFEQAEEEKQDPAQKLLYKSLL